MLNTILMILFYGGLAIHFLGGSRVGGIIAGVAAAVLAILLIVTLFH